MCDPPILSRPTGSQIPLTPMQLRTWKWSKATNEQFFGTRLLCAAAVRIRGDLDFSLLQKSMDNVVLRHESLRTTFIEVDGIPRQHVSADCDFQLDVLDLHTMDHSATDSEIQRVSEEFLKAEIDVSVEYPFAAKLLKVSARDHILIYALDHSVSDGTSLGILEREIWLQYHQACAGMPFLLPDLPIQFGDYSLWLHQTYEAWLSRNQAYWRCRLSGAPQISIPRSGSRQKRSDCALFEYKFEVSLTNSLKSLALRERTLLPLVVLAIYVAVINRWCESDDLLLTVVSSARHRPDLHSMIGYLASQLHLRIRLSKSDSFLSVLDRIRREFLTALTHEDFDRVPDFIPERQTYPEIHFNWLPSCISQRSFEYLESSTDRIQVQPYQLKIPWPFPFLAHFSEVENRINLIVRYLPHEFSLTVVEGFANAVRLYAEEFVRHDTAQIAQSPSPSYWPVF